MIIEISGLPNGQSIKHINVDITFDDIGSPITKVTSESTSLNKTEHNAPIETVSAVIAPPPSIMRNENERPIREVPTEMKDIVF